MGSDQSVATSRFFVCLQCGARLEKRGCPYCPKVLENEVMLRRGGQVIACDGASHVVIEKEGRKEEKSVCNCAEIDDRDQT
jgi:hypothetical protein